jgi:hypothetical protein
MTDSVDQAIDRIRRTVPYRRLVVAMRCFALGWLGFMVCFAVTFAGFRPAVLGVPLAWMLGALG